MDRSRQTDRVIASRDVVSGAFTAAEKVLCGTINLLRESKSKMIPRSCKHNRAN